MSRGLLRFIPISTLLVVGTTLLIWLFRVPTAHGAVNRLMRANPPIRVGKTRVQRFLDSRGWPHEDLPADPGAKKDPAEVE